MTGLAWMTTQEACDLLRVSEENADLIENLAAAIPMAVEMRTDYAASCVAGYNCDEIVKQLCRFLLQLWWNPDGTDSQQLARVIDSLTHTIKAMVATTGRGWRG